MLMTDSCDTSNRDADAMDGNRISVREFSKKFRGVRVREKIFGMNFKPSNGGAGVHHFGDMRKPQTDACFEVPLLCNLRHDDHPYSSVAIWESCWRRQCGRSSLPGHRSRLSDLR